MVHPEITLGHAMAYKDRYLIYEEEEEEVGEEVEVPLLHCGLFVRASKINVFHLLNRLGYGV